MNVMQSLPIDVSKLRARYPTRPYTVSDPNKLSYFARAGLVRMGLQNTAGAFSGLADTGTDEQAMPGAGQSVASFFSRLTDGLFGGGSGQNVSLPPADDTVLGLPKTVAIIGGVVLVGAGAFLLLRKGRSSPVAALKGLFK